MVEKEIKHIITSKLKHCLNYMYVEIIIFYVECLHHKSEVQGHAKLWKLFKCFNPKSFIRLKCTWNFPTHFTYGSWYFSSGITITEIHILGKLLFCNILNWIWSLILQNVLLPYNIDLKLVNGNTYRFEISNLLSPWIWITNKDFIFKNRKEKSSINKSNEIYVFQNGCHLLLSFKQ